MPRGKFALTNQKHYPDLSSERHQNGISALVPQTSFCGETIGGLANIGCFLRLGTLVYFSCAVSGFDQKPARGFRLKAEDVSIGGRPRNISAALNQNLCYPEYRLEPNIYPPWA